MSESPPAAADRVDVEDNPPKVAAAKTRRRAGAAPVRAARQVEQAGRPARAPEASLPAASEWPRPETPDRPEPEPAEMPSFRRLPTRDARGRAPIRRVDAPEQLAASPRPAPGTAGRSHGDPARKRFERGRPVRPGYVFAAGVAAGIAIACAGGDAVLRTDLVAALAGGRSLPARAERSVGPDVPRPAAAAAPSSAAADGAALPLPAAAAAALNDRLEREIGEQHLDQPPGDNALETYRQMSALPPEEVARAGRRLSAALWLAAENARAAAHWDEALHYLDILAALPGAYGKAGALATDAPANAEPAPDPAGTAPSAKP